MARPRHLLTLSKAFSTRCLYSYGCGPIALFSLLSDFGGTCAPVPRPLASARASSVSQARLDERRVGVKPPDQLDSRPAIRRSTRRDKESGWHTRRTNIMLQYNKLKVNKHYPESGPQGPGKGTRSSMSNIKVVAVDMDGTLCRSDTTINEGRLRPILARLRAAGCHFVVTSGNQYWQLRDFFPSYDEQLAFVAENGSFVKDGPEVVFVGQAQPEAVKATIDWIHGHGEVRGVMCGVMSAYVERGTVTQAWCDRMRTWYHRLRLVDDFSDVDDTIIKFFVEVPRERTSGYLGQLSEGLAGLMVPTTSGHGSIDIIIPGCHKASGIERLARRWDVSADQVIAFGDGSNDVEMLRYAGVGYAMENASGDAKAAADAICPSNDDEGVLQVLERLFPA